MCCDLAWSMMAPNVKSDHVNRAMVFILDPFSFNELTSTRKSVVKKKGKAD
jgi:hypothetical protein